MSFRMLHTVVKISFQNMLWTHNINVKGDYISLSSSHSDVSYMSFIDFLFAVNGAYISSPSSHSDVYSPYNIDLIMLYVTMWCSRQYVPIREYRDLEKWNLLHLGKIIIPHNSACRHFRPLDKMTSVILVVIHMHWFWCSSKKYYSDVAQLEEYVIHHVDFCRLI